MGRGRIWNSDVLDGKRIVHPPPPTSLHFDPPEQFFPVKKGSLGLHMFVCNIVCKEKYDEVLHA